MKYNIPEIIELYTDGYSTRTLGKIYSVSQSTMSRLLKNNNVCVRDKYDFSITSTNNRKTYSFDRNFFIENSDELAYMMGFLLADGNLYFSKKHKYARLSISIHSQDELILDFFKKISNYTKNTEVVPNNKTQKTLFFTDPIFKNHDFSHWGLVPNKTYNPSKLNVDLKYIKPFIIGYIDGDGSIICSKQKGYKFNIVGNKYTIDQIINYIQGLDCNYNFEWHWENPENKVWKRACLTKKEQLFHLVTILEPWNYFFLPRKWKSVLEHINVKF